MNMNENDEIRRLIAEIREWIESSATFGTCYVCDGPEIARSIKRLEDLTGKKIFE